MALSLRGGTSNYPYAVARVQAKRAKLIPPRDYEKLLKMDVSEITRFIEESDYKREVDELAQRFRGLDLLEAALTVNEERTFHSVRRMLAGEGGEILARYLDRFQVEALKTVLRGKRAGATREELLKELLLEDLDAFNLFQPLLADDVRTPEQVADALDRHGGQSWAQVLRQVGPDANPSAYEDALDKAYFARLLSALKTSKQTGAERIRSFVRQEIDAVNLQNAARWVHARQSADFSPYVVPGGRTFSVATIMQLAQAKDLEAFAEILKDHPSYDALRPGLAAARENGRLAPLQAAITHWRLGSLDQLARGQPLSILPILTYVLRKHQEVVTLRALARGKAAGLSEERLKELVL